MYILTTRGSIVDTEKVAFMGLSRDGCALCFYLSEAGKPFPMGSYGSEEDALQVLRLIFDAMRKGYHYFEIPTQNQLEQLPKAKEEPYHHATGKKMKRHGGS